MASNDSEWGKAPTSNDKRWTIRAAWAARHAQYKGEARCDHAAAKRARNIEAYVMERIGRRKFWGPQQVRQS